MVVDHWSRSNFLKSSSPELNNQENQETWFKASGTRDVPNDDPVLTFYPFMERPNLSPNTFVSGKNTFI